MRTMLTLLLGAGLVHAQTSYHDSVVVVLDASGSMEEDLDTGEEKMTAAKRALKTVLRRVPRGTHVGLLVFSGNVDNEWVHPLGPVTDRPALDARIEAIGAGGSTPLGEYMKKGADRLLADRAKQFGYGSYRLLVVTDGEATDSNLMERFTPDILSRGITVDVIGVAMRQEHTLATRVHSYRRADDPASLERAVQAVFAEVSAKDVQTAAAGQSAFDLIAGLQPELAMSIIEALQGSGNQPIGEEPRAPRRAEGGGSTSPPSSPSSAPQPACTMGGRGSGFPPIFLLIGLAWLRRRQRR